MWQSRTLLHGRSPFLISEMAVAASMENTLELPPGAGLWWDVSAMDIIIFSLTSLQLLKTWQKNNLLWRYCITVAKSKKKKRFQHIMLTDILRLVQLSNELIDAFIWRAGWAHPLEEAGYCQDIMRWKGCKNPETAWKFFPRKAISWVMFFKQMTPTFFR